MYKKKTCITLCIGMGFFFTFSSLVFAEPNIEVVTGEFSHSQDVVISGSNFGNKTPAKPLLWDDGTSNPPLSNYYDAWLPTNAQQGTQYNMAYRNVPYRGVNSPDSRIRYILGGAHAVAINVGTYSSGLNVGVGKNITSQEYFINYWYRIDPNYEEENNPTQVDNMKELALSNTAGAYYPDGWGAFGYVDWCNNFVPDVNQKEPIKLSRMPINPDNQDLPYECSGNNIVYHNNPINDWVKMQWVGTYNHQYDGPQISLTTYPDGKVTDKSHYGDGITVKEYARGPWANYPKENDLRFIGLGGFSRVPRVNNGVNSFRYFAGIYMDNTHSRVMLGDNPDYNSCTKMEPQIPSIWTLNSLTVSVNLGSFSDNDHIGYLFVFDSDNNHNPQGYPVALSENEPILSPPEEFQRIVR